jgi:hypothetical protein
MTATYFFQTPSAKSFEMIKRLISVVVDIHCVQNVPKDLLGQVGQSIGIF